LRRAGSDSRQRATAATAGLAAAALFGASAPSAKLLIPGTGLLVLAGLLYLGAGAGLWALSPLRRKDVEAPLRMSDVPTLAGMVVAGGLAGPVLLVLGLSRLSGVSASLLLNLEAPFTIVLAVLAFGDHLTPGEGLGAGAVVLGAASLAAAPSAIRLDAGGVAAVAGACAAWAVDNNLSQRLALRDPVAVARVKTLVAGLVSTGLGLAIGEHVPTARHAAAARRCGAPRRRGARRRVRRLRPEHRLAPARGEGHGRCTTDIATDRGGARTDL
jgi:drug/metabolite transporter (DMT)-like permease